MATRQQNNWNWAATTYVYTAGCQEYLTCYDTQQVWDGTKAGHRRLMDALVRRTEELRDRTGLAYRIYRPTGIGCCRALADEPEVIEVS